MNVFRKKLEEAGVPSDLSFEFKAIPHKPLKIRKKNGII